MCVRGRLTLTVAANACLRSAQPLAATTAHSLTLSLARAITVLQHCPQVRNAYSRLTASTVFTRDSRNCQWRTGPTGPPAPAVSHLWGPSVSSN